MSNEILSVCIPQVEDDIDIFEEVRAMLLTRKFAYLDMKPDYNSTSIIYRFQRQEDEQNRS